MNQKYKTGILWILHINLTVPYVCLLMLYPTGHQQPPASQCVSVLPGNNQCYQLSE